MARRYTITENPPPFTNGVSTTTQFNTDSNGPRIIQEVFDNRLTTIPIFNIIQKAPIKSPSTTVNNTVINQDITIINQGNSKVSAQYNHTNIINDITTRTQLINNGGLGTYDDNLSPIWATNKILSTAVKEFINIIINIKCTTDTLGGAFEIELNNGTVLDIIESNINIQDQDFNIEFNVITDLNTVTNGIRLFITPELGMSLNISTFSLLIIKG